MRTALALLALAALAGCHRAGSTPIETDPKADRLTGQPAERPRVLRDGAHAGRVGVDPGHAGRGTPLAPRPGNALAAFAAGCFWGVEDNFRQVPGVVATAVGYSGGHTDDPSYEAVCTHTTGHAETVLVEFDPRAVSYATLLSVFFQNHDPTTRDRQGPDVGDQYRSAVFTFSPAQAAAAESARDQASTRIGRPVVTVVEPLGRFWIAEDYHQQYDEKSGTHSCPTPKGLSPQGT